MHILAAILPIPLPPAARISSTLFHFFEITAIILGALGGGGSILAVPVLVFVAGQTPSQATTTSLLVVGAASVVGAVGHWRHGRVRLGAGVLFGLLGVAGVALAAAAPAAAPSATLIGLTADNQLVRIDTVSPNGIPEALVGYIRMPYA